MGDFDLVSSKKDNLIKNEDDKVGDGQSNDSQASAEKPRDRIAYGASNGAESRPPANTASADAQGPPRETFQEAVDRHRKAKGLPPVRRKPDRTGQIEQGHVLIYSGLSRYVVLRPDNVAVKFGKYLNFDEIDAIKFAKAAGIPVPEIVGWGQQSSPDGLHYIEMEYISGETLEAAWNGLSDEIRLDIAHQLREILRTMRALPAPDDYIGGFNSDRVIDARGMDTFIRPACRTEEEFNILLTMDKRMPEPIKRAYRSGMGEHKIVFTHCDIAPRNIMIRENRIVALIDWEGAGWYPEYWEYVKFMHFLDKCAGWKDLVDEIFPESYHAELLQYTGLGVYQDQWDNSPYQSKKGRNQELLRMGLPEESC